MSSVCIYVLSNPSLSPVNNCGRNGFFRGHLGGNPNPNSTKQHKLLNLNSIVVNNNNIAPYQWTITITWSLVCTSFDYYIKQKRQLHWTDVPLPLQCRDGEEVVYIIPISMTTTALALLLVCTFISPFTIHHSLLPNMCWHEFLFCGSM